MIEIDMGRRAPRCTVALFDPGGGRTAAVIRSLLIEHPSAALDAPAEHASTGLLALDWYGLTGPLRLLAIDSWRSSLEAHRALFIEADAVLVASSRGRMQRQEESWGWLRAVLRSLGRNLDTMPAARCEDEGVAARIEGLAAQVIARRFEHGARAVPRVC